MREKGGLLRGGERGGIKGCKSEIGEKLKIGASKDACITWKRFNKLEKIPILQNWWKERKKGKKGL